MSSPKKPTKAQDRPLLSLNRDLEETEHLEVPKENRVQLGEELGLNLGPRSVCGLDYAGLENFSFGFDVAIFQEALLSRFWSGFTRRVCAPQKKALKIHTQSSEELGLKSEVFAATALRRQNERLQHGKHVQLCSIQPLHETGDQASLGAAFLLLACRLEQAERGWAMLGYAGLSDAEPSLRSQRRRSAGLPDAEGFRAHPIGHLPLRVQACTPSTPMLCDGLPQGGNWMVMV